MKNKIFILLIALISVISVNALVKINEIEQAPEGGGSGVEWIELYNPELSAVNITGWVLIDASNNNYFLEGVIGPQGFFIIFPSFTLNNVNENVTLKDQFNITLDVSKTVSDGTNDNNTWQRIDDGFDTNDDSDWVFELGSFNFSNSADLIAPIIVDQTRDLDIIFENDDVILGCLINETNLVEGLIHGSWEGEWKNFTLNIIDHSAELHQLNFTLEKDDLESGETVEWFCIGEDEAGNFGNGLEESFEVVTTSKIMTFPNIPNGLDGWYITAPLIEINSDSRSNNSFYRFGLEPFIEFVDPFLFDINVTLGGIEELDFFSVFGGRNESINNKTFKVDTKSPVVRNVVPSDGSILDQNNITIIAILDDVYQGNSGIDESSIVLEVDDINIPVFVTEILGGDIEKEIIYETVLSDGKHKVKVKVKDVAGNPETEKIWFFDINTTINVFNMEILSPLNLNFSDKKILFNISLSDEVDKLYYINLDEVRVRERRLCNRCDSYDRLKRFNDGEYNLKIFGQLDDEVVVSSEVEFFVDSKKPDIFRTFPKAGDIISDTEFTVEYTEEFLERVELYVGEYNDTFNLSNFNLEIKNDCLRGRRKNCFFDLNLTEYNGKNIEYFFKLYDRVQNTTSRRSVFLIDSSMPEISMVNPFEGGNFSNKIPFNIWLSEEVDKLEFQDLEGRRPRFKRLCRNCDSYEKTKRFRDGLHHLQFRATDFAGNVGTTEVKFFVDRFV